MAENDSFAHYRVLRREDGSFHELGRGAMGVLYKAEDTRLHCTVALKVINATILNSELARARFLREARSAAKLHHPNVATVFHLQDEGDTYFYAMEFVKGENLDTYIARHGPLPLGQALNITSQVAGALVAAQREGLVHRDIKPSNLMLEEDEDEDEMRVKVVDFGLAKSFQGNSAVLTLSGFVGTAAFASPEQQDEREIDARADIYSLGATLWFMLTGRPVFTGSLAMVMSQHMQRPPPFADLGEIPASVRAVLERMLAKDPADRFQTPQEMRRELRVCMQEVAINAGTPSFLKVPSADDSSAALLVKIGSSAADSEPPLAAPRLAPTTGTVLARRYRLLETTGQGRSGGLLYAAEDLQEQRIIGVELLPPAYMRAEGENLDTLAMEVERVRVASHPNLVEVLAFERAEAHPFLVYEALRALSALDLLRARGALRLAEVLGLLDQLADAADHARTSGLDRLQLRLEDVFIAPLAPATGLAGGAAAPELTDLMTWAGRALEDWGGYRVKVQALDLRLDESGGDTLADLGRTMLPASEELRRDTRLGTSTDDPVPDDYLPTLGRLVYELLGGQLQAPLHRGAKDTTALLTARRPAALAALTERGNTLLQACFLPDPVERARHFPDARALFNALQQESRRGPMRHSGPTAGRCPAPPTSTPPDAAAGGMPPSAPVAQTLADLPPGPLDQAGLATLAELVAPGLPDPDPAPARLVPSASPTHTLVNRRRRAVLLGAATVGALGLAGVTAALVHSRGRNRWPGTVFPISPVVAPASSPSPALVSPQTSDATLPAPLTLPPSTEDPEHQLEAILRSGQDFENAGDWSNCLNVYLQAARRFPDYDAPKDRLTRVMQRLQPALDEKTFAQLHAPLVEVARTGSAPAMVLLGSRLLRSEPQEAFSWFKAAAERGRKDAMIQVGMMSLQGIGLKNPDAPGAVAWFEKAAVLGDDRAKYELAQLLLDGAPGVTPDPERAVELFRQAADLQNADAANRLGTLYRGDGGDRVPLPKSYPRAVKLFRQAQEAGNVDAAANLGAAYINGQGLEMNQPYGLELLAESARKGSPIAMLLYAKCLEKGIGTAKKKPDPGNARAWYVKAAAAGMQEARNWCLENRVDFARGNP